MPHTPRVLLRCLPLLMASVLAACHNGSNDPQPGPTDHAAHHSPGAAAVTQPSAFTGTLRGSAVAIGGETTGWRLEGDNQTGGIDVDVSKVRDRARALDGKRVNVAGRMTTRSWPERGQTQVLVADSIEEAPRQGPGGAGGR